MTDKQMLFISEYLINGFNATQAAISAGYSEKTAYSQGQRLLKDVEVSENIRKSIDEALGQNKSTLKLEILHELRNIAFTEFGIDIKRNKDGEIYEVSRRDKLRALELLGKYMTMFTDKAQVEHTGTMVLFSKEDEGLL